MAITIGSCKKINQKNELPMGLLTENELLQYVKDNDTGVTEADLEVLDINDFINYSNITGERLGLYGLKQLLAEYSTSL